MVLYFSVCLLFCKADRLENLSKIKSVFIEMAMLTPIVWLDLGHRTFKQFSMSVCAENPEDILVNPTSSFQAISYFT